MVILRILMFIVVINIGIEIEASHFTKYEHSMESMERIATMMKSLEKIDRRISSSSKEILDDFSRFKLKVRGEYAWRSDISDTITYVKSLIELALWVLLGAGLIGFIFFFRRILLSHKYVIFS